MFSRIKYSQSRASEILARMMAGRPLRPQAGKKWTISDLFMIAAGCDGIDKYFAGKADEDGMERLAAIYATIPQEISAEVEAIRDLMRDRQRDPEHRLYDDDAWARAMCCLVAGIKVVKVPAKKEHEL
jgi:hypothetical protein